MKNIIEGKEDENAHRQFVRFGKGNYRRTFLISVSQGKKIKVRASFELANDLVAFVRENKDVKFSGKVLMLDKVPGKVGRKKSGSFVYEISESSLEEFENPYFYLLDANSEDLVLKIKKKLPKPGKNVAKIDDKFCSLDAEVSYWSKIKENFFWDLPDNFKKATIEHELVINEIVYPEGEEDSAKIRELSKRKGKIIRKVTIDGDEKTTEFDLVV